MRSLENLACELAVQKSFTPLTIGFSLRNFPRHKSSQLAFLAWVAYTRRYSGNAIAELELRRCPLLWCRTIFETQEEMLKHVYNCEHLAKGLYWCCHCQKAEKVGKDQCKKCQGLPSRTHRLASVAKRIFSMLGTKGRREDVFHAEPVDVIPFFQRPEPVFEEDFDTQNGNWHSPDHQPTYARVPEMPDNSLSEMTGSCQLVELGPASSGWSAGPHCAQYRQLVSPSLSAGLRESPQADTVHPGNADADFDAHAPRPYRRDTLQYEFSTESFDLPRSANHMAPINLNRTIDPDTVSVSPNSERSCESFDSYVNDSGYTSATTQPSRNSSEDSIERNSGCTHDQGLAEKLTSGPIFEEPECLDDVDATDPGATPSMSRNLPVIWDVSRLESDVASDVPNAVHVAGDCALAEEHGDFSPYWSDANSLVQTFAEVLDEHVFHSKTTLKNMQANAEIRELLAMSTSSISVIGLDVIEGILKGRLPVKVVPIFAFTSVAYAFAIVVHDDPSIVQRNLWFKDALAWKEILPSGKQRETYEQIAAALWQPHEVSASGGVPSQESREEPVIEDSNANQLLSSCKHFLDCKFFDLVDHTTADRHF